MEKGYSRSAGAEENRGWGSWKRRRMNIGWKKRTRGGIPSWFQASDSVETMRTFPLPRPKCSFPFPTCLFSLPPALPATGRPPAPVTLPFLPLFISVSLPRGVLLSLHTYVRPVERSWLIMVLALEYDFQERNNVHEVPSAPTTSRIKRDRSTKGGRKIYNITNLRIINWIFLALLQISK